jgi:hypothetical protein
MNVANKSMENINANVVLNDEHSSMKSFVFVILALWLGLVVLLGSQGAFIGSAGSPPLPIFFGFATPLALFFGAYFGWSAFVSLYSGRICVW